MTGEQAKWLTDHRQQGYRPVGRPPGGARWVKRGILHADGAFDLQQGNARPRVDVGSFEVGILEMIAG